MRPIMTQPEDKFGAIDPLGSDFRGYLNDFTRWTLCIGAGVSDGIVPKWKELARRVVNRAFGADRDEKEFEQDVAQSGWRLDSWIQAAWNELRQQGRSRSDFNQTLQEILYADLKARICNEKGRVPAIIFGALQRPTPWYNPTTTDLVCDFFQRHYGETSLLRLADALVKLERTGRMPFAILSFNVEPLFHTVLNCFLHRSHRNLPKDAPRTCVERVTRPNFVRSALPPRGTNSRTVFFYHCHGTLLPRSLSPLNPVRFEGRGDPILLEEDYAGVSSCAGTWPETVFMYHANLSRMVFVGLSMSDPNIRRWLGLAQEQFSAGKVLRGGLTSPPHLWLHKKPPTSVESQINEAGLLHLGVRAAWIADWGKLRLALENLAIPS